MSWAGILALQMRPLLCALVSSLVPTRMAPAPVLVWVYSDGAWRAWCPAGQGQGKRRKTTREGDGMPAGAAAGCPRDEHTGQSQRRSRPDTDSIKTGKKESLKSASRLGRRAESLLPLEARPDSPVPTLQGPCGRSPKRRRRKAVRDRLALQGGTGDFT